MKMNKMRRNSEQKLRRESSNTSNLRRENVSFVSILVKNIELRRFIYYLKNWS